MLRSYAVAFLALSGSLGIAAPARSDHLLVAAHVTRPIALAHEELMLPVEALSGCTAGCESFEAAANYVSGAAEGSVEERAPALPAASLVLRIPAHAVAGCCYGAGTMSYWIEVRQRRCSPECDEAFVRLPAEGFYHVLVIG